MCAFFYRSLDVYADCSDTANSKVIVQSHSVEVNLSESTVLNT